jgi:prevent-host-death family protein
VDAYEAETRLPELLERVDRGERITITKHGVAVAMLVGVSAQARHDPREMVAALREFRQGRRLGRTSLRTLIAEGRR